MQRIPPHRVSSRDSRHSVLHRTAPRERGWAARACAALVLGSGVFLILGLGAADGELREPRTGPEDWKETDAGSVPNNYGDLFTVAGPPNRQTLVFRNSDGELRIVEFSGGKVPSRATLILREEPEKGDVARRSNAGIVPARFGELISFDGVKGNYSLVFRDDEDTVRLIAFQGTKLKKAADVIRRDTETSMGETPDDGWIEKTVGTIPSAFGTVVTVAGTATDRTVVCQNDDGKVRLIKFTGGQLPKAAQVIGREYQ